MAYYAALVSIIQLIEDNIELISKSGYKGSLLLGRFRELRSSLKDYFPEDKATADSWERQIRDAAYEAQDIIETMMSNQCEQYFEVVKDDVGSIMEELMRIKESYASHEGHSAGIAGASTQASPKVGASAVRTKGQYLADQLSVTIIRLQRKGPVDSYPGSARYDEQITSLIEKLRHFQELLLSYSQKHINIQVAGSLETRIHGAFNDADQVIKPGKSKNLEKKLQKKYCKSLRKVGKEVWSMNEANLIELKKLNQAKEVVDSVVESLTTNQDNLQVICYSANNAGTSTQAPNFDSSAGSSKVRAVSGKYTVVGLDDWRMETIKAQLCGEPSKLQVVSIVGMGGIGKTTWARCIFDDNLIRERFDCCAWVTVSQDYHLRNTLLAIARSLSVNNIEESHGVGDLKQLLYGHLYGRRYLIILDDVWDTKFWDEMKRISPDLKNGSRVMITTRQSNVASYASTSDKFIHKIPLLVEHQSWDLFCFGVSCPPELEDIGKSIARKCGGLPLAIVVIAGLLSKSRMTKYDWEKIEMNISSTVAKSDEQFSQILSLSYNFMPHHLKPCFLHLGGFPEDCQIQASRLIKLWVAEGFVEPFELESLEEVETELESLEEVETELESLEEVETELESLEVEKWHPTKSKSLVEVAEGYLEDLVDRNLVLITKRKSSGKIKYCSIHDLLRGWCLQRSRHDNFLHVMDKNDLLNSEPATNLRRLHISRADSFLCFSEVKKYSLNVRSLYSFVDVGDHFLSVASDFKLLRVLNAVDTGTSPSPDEIVKLLHLRYLGIPYLPIVPPSISKLQNLETIVLEGDETILPSEFWNMQRLRHVIIRGMTLSPVPQGEMITDRILLERLQTLSTVVDFVFTRDTIEMIPGLKKLKVLYKEASKSWDAFDLDNLFRLSQLETLHIEIYLGESNMNIPVKPLPQNFDCSQSLKKLSLSGCRLPWSDMTVVGSLPNLQVLKLRRDSFLGEEWETTEGQFLNLKFLLMEELLYLKDWQAENTHFPLLERLIIRECGQLQEIPSDIGYIDTLQLIEVYGSELAANSALRIQEEQREYGNDVLQVHV